jgi:hypothetical protein
MGWIRFPEWPVSGATTDDTTLSGLGRAVRWYRQQTFPRFFIVDFL